MNTHSERKEQKEKYFNNIFVKNAVESVKSNVADIYECCSKLFGVSQERPKCHANFGAYGLETKKLCTWGTTRPSQAFSDSNLHTCRHVNTYIFSRSL